MASCSTRYPHWFNGNIRYQLNIACSLRKKVKKQPSVFNNFMLEQEAYLQRDILSAKNQFESDFLHKSAFDNNNPRLFKYIKKSLKEHVVTSMQTFCTWVLHLRAWTLGKLHSLISTSSLSFPHIDYLLVPPLFLPRFYNV